MAEKSLEERQAEMRARMRADSNRPLKRDSDAELQSQPRRTKEGDETATSRPVRHQLVANTREFFEAGRLSEVGYLRPLKRNLVDIFVSRETLSYALDTANELFQAFEDRGHRVTLASGFHRPELYVHDEQKLDPYGRESWSPGRETVVFIGSVPFGLTVYETAEKAEVRYEWNAPIRYVRASAIQTKRRPDWAGTTKTYKHMPNGCLAVRGYSPYRNVNWEKRWFEKMRGEISPQFKTIVKALEAALPTITTLRQEAQRHAEIEHERWKVQMQEYELREAERRRVEALKTSREQLIAIVEAWSFVRSFESFFEDTDRRASALPTEQRDAILRRIAEAREMLGGTDTLAHFQKWKSASER